MYSSAVGVALAVARTRTVSRIKLKSWCHGELRRRRYITTIVPRDYTREANRIELYNCIAALLRSIAVHTWYVPYKNHLEPTRSAQGWVF